MDLICRHNKPENKPAFFKEMSDECMSRAIAILDTVFKSIESLGGSINSDLSVKIRDDIVRFRIVEIEYMMNISYGYVSHSFNQRICTDGDYLYRVDLGDAYPRGIAYTKTSVDKAINRPTSYGTAHPIAGTVENNYTGYNLGGVELSSKNTVITGSGLKNDVGNVWITVVNSKTGEVATNWITNYVEGNAINVMQPKLVKLANDNQFLILWEEYAGSYYKRTYTTKYALMNADGTLASKIYTTPLALSACEPILNAKGNVCWYVTNNAEPVFVEINPYACDSVASQSAGDTTFAGSGNGSGNGNDDEGGDDIGNGNNNNDEDVEKADNIALSGIAHVQSFGDKSGNWKDGTLTLGTTGLAKRLESVTINLVNDTGLTGGLQYRVHRQTYGWTNWVTDGKPAGTVGEAKRLEAIKIALSGEVEKYYDVYYRVHAQSYGWLGWAKNGNPAGTAGYAKRLEAIQVVLVPKGSGAPSKYYGGVTSSDSRAYVSK